MTDATPTPDERPSHWLANLGPASVPHACEQWQVIETHISWVILTGTWAYKIKKPVQFEFVDYHTLDQRHRFCDLELELNRRFCPELYVAVVPIVATAQGLKIDPAAHGLPDAPAEVTEYAVKMQQFPQKEIVANHLLASDQPVATTRTLAAQFGQDLAQRHAQLPSLAAARRDWYLAGVEHDSAENFHYFLSQPQVSPAPSTTPTLPTEHSSAKSPAGTALPWRERFARLETWTTEHLAAIRSALATRATTGHVRQCHGDLHLQNIVMWQGRWAAFDGIEFNDQFQWIDVLSEVAFTAMDLQAHGRADLGAVLLSDYLEATGEYHELAVLRFFLVYRAMVRAKVGHLKGQHSGSLTADQLSLEGRVDPTCDSLPDFLTLPEWQRYAWVAERLALDPQPKLIIMHGLSGSGKSTVAQRLVAEQRGLRIRSDRLRQLLPADNDRADRYAATSRDRVYEELAAVAADILRAGFTAIVDATFLQRRHRQTFAALAQTLQVPFFIAACSAAPEELARRILARTNDPSEATLDVLHQQQQEQESLSAEELALRLPT